MCAAPLPAHQCRSLPKAPSTCAKCDRCYGHLLYELAIAIPRVGTWRKSSCSAIAFRPGARFRNRARANAETWCMFGELVHDFEIVHVQAKAVAPTWRKKLLRCKSFWGLKKLLHVLTPGYSSIDNTSHKVGATRRMKPPCSRGRRWNL